MVKNKHEGNYFLAGPIKEADMTVNTKVIGEIYNDHDDIFQEGYFKDSFSLQVKEGRNHTFPDPSACHRYSKSHSGKNCNTFNNSK